MASSTAFICADTGANSVTLTATDVSSNVATCIATVTVQDTASPTALCQDLTVFLDAAGNATITAGDVDNGSTDNCGSAMLMASPTAFTCADSGANSVTLTVTDVSSNSATCIATVTVQDTASPIAVCQDITVILDPSGNASITAADIDGGSSDNCGSPDLNATPTGFTCADSGANSVTLTVTDVSSNSSSCVATVTVQDTTPPNTSCRNITIQLDGSGNASITAGDINFNSTDNCGIASLAVSPNAFTCADVGVNLVTLTGTDVSGNSKKLSGHGGCPGYNITHCCLSEYHHFPQWLRKCSHHPRRY